MDVSSDSSQYQLLGQALIFQKHLSGHSEKQNTTPDGPLTLSSYM